MLLQQRSDNKKDCMLSSRPGIHDVFNSIQFRHLYAPANEHHVGAHGEDKKLKRIIKYMNEKRKKSINHEKVRFQFCSEGVEQSPGSRKSTGSEFHTADAG